MLLERPLKNVLQHHAINYGWTLYQFLVLFRAETDAWQLYIIYILYFWGVVFLVAKWYDISGISYPFYISQHYAEGVIPDSRSFGVHLCHKLQHWMGWVSDKSCNYIILLIYYDIVSNDIGNMFLDQWRMKFQ